MRLITDLRSFVSTEHPDSGHQRRELEDLVARMDELEARNGDASGALNFGKIIKGAAHLFLRDEDDLMARRSVPPL